MNGTERLVLPSLDRYIYVFFSYGARKAMKILFSEPSLSYFGNALVLT
jgi:hypothetical protein